jgi:hypothetical protein
LNPPFAFVPDASPEPPTSTVYVAPGVTDTLSDADAAKPPGAGTGSVSEGPPLPPAPPVAVIWSEVTPAGTTNDWAVPVNEYVVVVVVPLLAVTGASAMAAQGEAAHTPATIAATKSDR